MSNTKTTRGHKGEVGQRSVQAVCPRCHQRGDYTVFGESDKKVWVCCHQCDREFELDFVPPPTMRG